MSIDLWISIALAIPLAIVANLFTPKLQKWLDSRLERSKKAKIEKKEAARQLQLGELQKELLEVSKLHSDKADLNQLFLVSLIKVAMYGAIGTIYGAIFPLMGELTSWGGDWWGRWKNWSANNRSSSFDAHFHDLCSNNENA
ncbi:hypothetical protein [Methylohalobius crimeensis]|uniref:hypothetical protein n=1 Tax=Methylohalobius crimeensis TaxID=244365 RepID=UPI0003B64EC5|nr:hypothetical protein [Methylohalobius crimeensis]